MGHPLQVLVFISNTYLDIYGLYGLVWLKLIIRTEKNSQSVYPKSCDSWEEFFSISEMPLWNSSEDLTEIFIPAD